jgi:RNAse (barnase) inhibitor barstar
MKTITLNGETYTKLDDFFDDVATQLSFPSHFVHNLTSFAECLVGIAHEDPITIHWKNYGHARYVFGVSEMGVNYLPAILTMLSETKGVTLMLE